MTWHLRWAFVHLLGQGWCPGEARLTWPLPALSAGTVVANRRSCHYCDPKLRRLRRLHYVKNSFWLMVEIYFQHCRFYLAQFLCNEDCCRSELLFPILVSRRLQSQSASAGCGGERGAALTAGGKQGLAASSCCAQPGPESQGVRAALPARCFQP